MASQSHKICVADSSSSRHLSQVGSSLNWLRTGTTFTRRYIPEDRTLRDHGYENLKSYINFTVVMEKLLKSRLHKFFPELLSILIRLNISESKLHRASWEEIWIVTCSSHSLQETNIMHVSVRPHVSTRKLLGRFWWNLLCSLCHWRAFQLRNC
jgi:hypothetical protein